MDMGCLLHSFCPSACDKHLHWRRTGVLFRTGTGAVCCSLFVLQPVIVWLSITGKTVRDVPRPWYNMNDQSVSNQYNTITLPFQIYGSVRQRRHTVRERSGGGPKDKQAEWVIWNLSMDNMGGGGGGRRKGWAGCYARRWRWTWIRE